MPSELETAARELIIEFGGTGTYSSFVQGSYDPNTGEVVNTKLDQPVYAALLDLTLQSNGLSLKYGTEIKAGDKEAYVIPPDKSGGQAVQINPGKDKLTFGGVTYTVVTFKEANPSGADSWVWYLYLRR